MTTATISMEEMMRAGCATRRALRLWEDKGLFGTVARTNGDTRRYTPAQLNTAKIIAAAQFGGFELEVIKQMLDEYDHTVFEALTMRLADQIRAAIRLQENLPKPPAQEYDL